MTDAADFRALSWRDPDGAVLDVDGRILRVVAHEKADQIRTLIGASWLSELVTQRSIPATVEISAPAIGGQFPKGTVWLEHERLSFPCYPHEVTALQLYDSAQLTLQLALVGARNGWTLKDASAWNVLHSDGRAVFVDLLSFDRQALTGMWRAYGQFVRHFILPLLLYRKVGLIPPEVFLPHRDGITPEWAFGYLRGTRLLSMLAIEHVFLPKVLAGAGSRMIARQRAVKPRVLDADIASHLAFNTLLRLQRTLRKLRPNEAKTASVWKSYEEERAHYSDADLKTKSEFVKSHVAGSGTVLDLGCNAGEFSRIAAATGASVVAADADHGALSRLYGRIRGTRERITPVWLNIGRPTPSVGWLNDEVRGFLERSAGRFDCVFALGLVHHLLVSERATLPMIVALFERLAPKRLIFEWVDPTDRKFQELAGFDYGLYRGLDSRVLEAAFSAKFCLKDKLALPCATRVMYLWER